MHFGSRDLTPFVQAAFPLQPFYYVNLRGISIGNTQVPIPQGTFDVTKDGGGFIVDSGSSVTLLREEVYESFVRVMGQFVTFVPDPSDEGFDFCFKRTQKDLDNVPLVTFHFAGGVDVKLTKEVTFTKSEGEAGCLAITQSHGTMSAFGNVQMANLNVGYDLVRNGISFTQADCSASTS